MRAIAAMCGDRVIGFHGEIPWHKTLDMRFFKAMTWDHDVIVGRTTYSKLPYLPNRFLYVLSSKEVGARVQTFYRGGIADIGKFVTADDILKLDHKDMWVIGGAKTYQQFLPHCSDLYMTFVLEDHEGDTYMPEFEHMFDEQQVIYEGKDMWIIHYWKQDIFQFEENAYREGFDARLMGKPETANPYKLSYHPRDTTYDDECNYQWSCGWDEAPIVKGINT